MKRHEITKLALPSLSKNERYPDFVEMATGKLPSLISSPFDTPPHSLLIRALNYPCHVLNANKSKLVPWSEMARTSI